MRAGMLRNSPARRRGAVLAMALVVLLVVGLLAGLLVQRLMASHRQARRQFDQLQAEWLAEAAVGRAIRLRQANSDYQGEKWRVELVEATSMPMETPSARGASEPQVGVVEIHVEAAAGRAGFVQIIAAARFPGEGPRRTSIERTYILPLADEAAAAN